ncbi:MAG: CHC2 zinc finger domain-containing protein, partial [Patescibacteria group bacterium]
MSDLDAIRERVNIVDLISESITLKKAGRNFKGLCPFHGERTPSFVVSPERQIWHCFGCFPPGEKIKTPFGHHNIEDIDKDHWVISGKGNIKKVIQTMTHHYEGNLVSITLKKLRFTTRLTADHKVYVIAGAPYTQKKYKDFSKRYRKLLHLDKKTYQEKVNKYFPIKQIPAGSLKTGNLLLYPLQRNVNNLRDVDLSQYISKSTCLGPVPKKLLFKLPISNDLLTFIGYYIAEGSSHRAYIRFSVGSHEEIFAQEIVHLGKKLFGLEAKIHRRRGPKTGIEITLCHSNLANIFVNLCGKGARNKHIPFIFQELPAFKQKVIVDAIHRGDGTTFQVHRSKKIQKSITSTSLILTEQLVDILLRCNFFPNLHVEKTHTDKNNVHHQESYSIYWSEQYAQKYNLTYFNNDGSEYWILPIDYLKSEKYSGSVYNLTIADDHSYVTSSFAVSNCGKGGDAFTFLMELDRLEFPEAVKILAERAGVALTSVKGDSQTRLKERLQALHVLAADYYHYLLTKHQVGERALLYLKERGMTDALIKTFDLGFAPSAWDNVCRFLQKKGYAEHELQLSGLAIAGRSGLYDRFRGRVMFPIRNYRGTTIAFSGRLLDKEAKEAKYINSPETPLYSKGSTLYGIDITKEAIRKVGSAVVVEGEFDLISSYHAGVGNVVAIKGTALTEAQIALIKRFAERIFLSLDADVAGDAAVRRGIEIADQLGVEILVVG